MPTPNALEMKRGEDFELTGTPDIAGVTDYANWTATAQVRDLAGILIDTFETTLAASALTAPLLTLRAPAARTAGWPLGTLRTDVRFVSPTGRVIHTPTGEFACLDRITIPTR